LLLLLALDGPQRAVMAPLLALVNIAGWFVIVLWNRDSQLPIFEVGPVCVVVTTIYCSYPLFSFLMAGGRWTPVSDNRLLHANPGLEEIGAFAWRYVVYLGALALAYLHVRGRATADRMPLQGLSRSAATVVIWLFAVLTVYFAAIWIYFGVTYKPTYSDVQLGIVGTSRDLPYLLQQLSHNLQGALVIIKLCAIALLVQRWHSPASRALLVGWLAIEVVATGLRMGARTETMMLLMAAGLLYHRLVRPLRPSVVGTAGISLVALSLLYGLGRDFATARGLLSDTSAWSAANEFQILLGTAYDLFTLKNAGALESIPWQVHASEILMLIPSQILPVEKISPDAWYLTLLPPQSRGAGLMFGVTSQAIIGYDWIELVARGVILGMFFALAHRLYVRHAHAFWATLLYLYLCVWAYYTYRSTTFYFLYVVLYRFVPVMVAVRVGAGLVRSMGRARGPRGAPAPATVPCAGS
jgi:hypothetical protein